MLRQPAARSSSSIVDVVVAVLEEDDGDDLDIANDAAGVATAVPFAAVVLDYVLVVVVAVLFFFFTRDAPSEAVGCASSLFVCCVYASVLHLFAMLI